MLFIILGVYLIINLIMFIIGFIEADRYYNAYKIQTLKVKHIVFFGYIVGYYLNILLEKDIYKKGGL